MVKTRAQRVKGVFTPSPAKTKSQKVDESDKESVVSNSTQKDASGTEEKSRSTRSSRSVRVSDIPLETPNRRKPRASTGQVKHDKNKKIPSRTKKDEDWESDTDEEQEKDNVIDDEEMNENIADVKGKNDSPADDTDVGTGEDDGKEEEAEEDEELKNASIKAGRKEEMEVTAEGREDDDDDDDAPEDVSFSRSRHDALEFMSQALQQSRRTDERAREKRRNRDKLLKLQKESKKISLQHSRLPDDFLSEIAKQSEGQSTDSGTQLQIQPLQTSAQRGHNVFNSDNEEEMDDYDNYIPLSSDKPHIVRGFEVKAISHEKRAPPPKSDTVLDFLQKQLYGSKVKRESVNKRVSRLLKRRGQPGMIFKNPKEKRKKHRGIRSTHMDQSDI